MKKCHQAGLTLCTTRFSNGLTGRNSSQKKSIRRTLNIGNRPKGNRLVLRLRRDRDHSASWAVPTPDSSSRKTLRMSDTVELIEGRHLPTVPRPGLSSTPCEIVTPNWCSIIFAHPKPKNKLGSGPGHRPPHCLAKAGSQTRGPAKWPPLRQRYPLLPLLLPEKPPRRGPWRPPSTANLGDERASLFHCRDKV